jgi:exopolyphosphatase/pppGpp-phosphohydrolase
VLQREVNVRTETLVTRQDIEHLTDEIHGLEQSMRAALDDLGLERLDVVHAGERTFPLAEKIRAVAFSRLFEDIR